MTAQTQTLAIHPTGLLRTGTSRQQDQSLATRILTHFKTSKFDTTDLKFLPEGAIDGLLAVTVIQKALKIKQSESPDLFEFIRTKARKTFLITAHLGVFRSEKLLQVMQLFKDNGFDDCRLPIDKPPEPTQSGHRELHSFEMFEEIDENDSDIDLDELLWYDQLDRISRFWEDQEKFLAPVLRTSKSNFNLREHSTLPFISKEDIKSNGFFSNVYKIEIHKDHFHDDDPLQLNLAAQESSAPAFFALKQLKPGEELRKKVEDTWDQEASALKQMNGLEPDAKRHVVRFITAFRRGDKDHCLLLEWADGGSLRNVWMDKEQPKLSPSLVKCAIKQLLGLATALCAAHNLDGTGSSVRHGDLKPENILCFKDETEFWTLKIGDWGLAKRHNVPTQFRSRPTSTRHGTLTYEPPEAVTEMTAPGRSRLYDIWSMGVIILEFLIWLVYGKDELTRFNVSVRGESEKETPCYQFEWNDSVKTPKVHGTVTAWMKHMASQAPFRPQTPLGDLLMVVRDKLLVVALPPGMGEPSGSDITAGSNNPVTVALTEDPDDGSDPTVKIQHRDSKEPVRALASALKADLTIITNGGQNKAEVYWSSYSHAAMGFRGPQDSSKPAAGITLQVPQEKLGLGKAAQERPRESMPGAKPGPSAVPFQRTNYAPPKLNNEWDRRVDNELASNLMAALAADPPKFALPGRPLPARLCGPCQKLRFWDVGFDVQYRTSELKERAKNCDLCALFWKTCDRYEKTWLASVRFDRVGSALRMNGSDPVVLSIVRDPRLATESEIQIGLPFLPGPGSELQWEILRQWLKQCDKNHGHPPPRQDSAAKKGQAQRVLPKRLIDVGVDGDTVVKLWKTSPKDLVRYVALSHRWGTGKQFETRPENLTAHEAGIELEALPATFRDAARVARALGIRYLWIDSICIVQGPDGDFNTESKRMETVYSSAACVIAASRATGHYDGFLKPRVVDRHCVTMYRPGVDPHPFYVCENIDDFQSDVLEGDLNRRGWVFQEHALARRTMFFTENQVYFECGDGVRCETLTWMRNGFADFLGDSNFPEFVMNTSQGNKIVRFQDLYKTYSTLDLSRETDRPIAIDGLQSRLLHAFKAKGGFGVFDEGPKAGLLRRSLLWVRREPPARGAAPSPQSKGHNQVAIGSKALARIPPASGLTARGIPSWSWMAYTGQIDYLQPDFARVAWEPLTSPWSAEFGEPAGPHGGAPPAGNYSAGRGPSDTSIALVGVARDVLPPRSRPAPAAPQLLTPGAGAKAAGGGLEEGGKLVYDRPGGSEGRSAGPQQCVVLGVQVDDKMHFVLLVAPTNRLDRSGDIIYERVGAGYLPRDRIDTTGEGTRIKIH